jgi:hypothetical protein
MLLPLAILLIALAAFSAGAAARSRHSQLTRIRAQWGAPRDRDRDMDAIAQFFRADLAEASADAKADATATGPASAKTEDRTWNDLLLDDVFAWLDRTESSVGQQLLYDRLRRSPAASLEAFEALVERMTKDVSLRERAQLSLHRLRDASVYHVHRLARPGALQRSPNHLFFPIWTGVIMCGLLLAFVWPPLLLFIGIVAFVVNLSVRGATGRRVSSEIVAFRQIGPLLTTARELIPVGTPATAPLTGRLAADLSALRRLGAIARWVSRDATTGAGELVGAVLEYLNVLFLMDVNALYFAGRELQLRGHHLLDVIRAAGEIDAAIAIASWRASESGWTQPRFAAPGAPAIFEDVVHPLVDQAVPNSLHAAPPHGVLITGSNMSGKSTFLRTIGVNIVLAQTVHTVLARTYEAPVYHVRSCIGRSDDLMAGKSYYLVEVESVLALVHASRRPGPHLFIFDELFRGTNAVERIAAAEAVLDALVTAGHPHVALAATHDGELVDLLADKYAVYHLGDAVGPDGLVFDYRLTEGPATSRNAITLLKLNGAPESLVERALARAAVLDRTRSGVRS